MVASKLENTKNLREFLSLRGIEYETSDNMLPHWTDFEFDGDKVRFSDFGNHTELIIKNITAEEVVGFMDGRSEIRDLLLHLYTCAIRDGCSGCQYSEDPCDFEYDMRMLGIEE